jgi:hypothetical protein
MASRVTLIPGKPSNALKVSFVTGCTVKLPTRFTARAASFAAALTGALNSNVVSISALLG